MATRFALEHIGTRQFVTVCPSLTQPVQAIGYSPRERDAATYATMPQAEMERLGLGEFADTCRVVPIDVAWSTDEPLGEPT